MEYDGYIHTSVRVMDKEKLWSIHLSSKLGGKWGQTHRMDQVILRTVSHFSENTEITNSVPSTLQVEDTYRRIRKWRIVFTFLWIVGDSYLCVMWRILDRSLHVLIWLSMFLEQGRRYVFEFQVKRRLKRSTVCSGLYVLYTYSTGSTDVIIYFHTWEQ